MPASDIRPRLEAARGALAAAPREALARAEAMLRDFGMGIDVLEVLALAKIALGRSDEAAAHLAQIVALDPAARWARDDLARLHLAQGRRAEAEAVLRAALAQDETNADAHALLGTLLAERESLPEAQRHLERAIALAGRVPDLLVNLGRVLMRRGDLACAGRLASEAAAASPGSLGAMVLGAEVAEQAGAHEAALAWLARAEPLARRSGTDVALLRFRLVAATPHWREALAALDPLESPGGAALLLRGRLRDRAGRHAQAWDDFVAGKAALSRPHDSTLLAARMAAEIGAAARGWPAGAPTAGGPQPVFILGAPRSGTTMTEQVLAAHARVRAGGELPFVVEIAAIAARELGPDWPEALAASRGADLPTTLRDHYLARAADWGLLQAGARWFTDKMPLNEAHLPLIRLTFPEAPLVLVRRHPLDVLVSAMSHDMTHGGNAFYSPATAAAHLAAVGAFVEACETRLGIVPHRLVYERFVADPAGETGALMALLGLDPEPAQARFHELARHAPTPSYAQVREPLHARSIGRWRSYAAQLAPYRALLAPLMAQDGYDAGA